MALFTMMPARASKPSIALKSSLAPDRFKPSDAPMRMSGIVKMMISVRRKELNCQMRRTTIATNSADIEEKSAVCLLARLYFAADGPVIILWQVDVI